MIILLYGRIAVDVTRGRGVFAVPRRRATAALIAGGSVYLAVMALRYAIRMTLYRPERWSGGSIPIFFHWVLAGFICSASTTADSRPRPRLRCIRCVPAFSSRSPGFRS